MEQQKICSRCKQLKPIEVFNKRSDSLDGYRGACIQCEENRHLQTKVKARVAISNHEGEKFCYKCNTTKPTNDFGTRLDSPDGRRASCRKCEAAGIKGVPRPVGLKSRIVDLPNGNRVCSRCKIPQPLTSFTKAKAQKLGYFGECKTCVAQRNKGRQKTACTASIEGAKVCHVCKKFKDIVEFGLRRKASDGRKDICKLCTNEVRVKRESPIVDNLDGTRICTKCNIAKPLLTDFSPSPTSKLGKCGQCKACILERNKAYIRKNRVVVTEGTKRCSRCKREKSVLEFGIRKGSLDGRSCYCFPCDREEANEWARNHPEATSAIRKRTYQKRGISTRLRNNLRSAVNRRLRKGELKAGSAIVDLGCSIEEFEKHLESLWTPGMCWKNHSQYGWVIDHIKPLASFDLTVREQFLQACHYTNMQPMWWQDNASKQALPPEKFTRPLSSGPAPRPERQKRRKESFVLQDDPIPDLPESFTRQS